jgi:hypothetical protein
MLNKTAQQSLLDMLFQIMPELRDKMTAPAGVRTNNKAAKVLYTIWSKEANRISANRFRCPKAVMTNDKKLLESEGLVTASGDQLTITSKGGEVIKQMILGDNRSVFDYDGEPIEYLKAVANTAPARRKYGNKIASVQQLHQPINWYERAMYGN